jgi:radical S-adenosyl methionine domain-containing protein 2
MQQITNGVCLARRGACLGPQVDRTADAELFGETTLRPGDGPSPVVACATFKIPVSINFHLVKQCNARCPFCFATFPNVRGRLPTPDARRVVDLLHAAGGEKITFAGGEPTLHPDIGELVEHAKEIGFVTGVVTNGARLGELLKYHGDALDWVALSVDSALKGTQAALGRGRGDHIRRSVNLSDRCRDHGVKLKLNTVVTALNRDEDMSGLVRRVAPQRWKVFQVLRVVGQNDGRVEPLLIADEQFRAFVQRHAHLESEGYPAIAEDNDAMTDSYVMVDPLGCFFGNTGGVHRIGQSILDVGVERAFAPVQFDGAKFAARGGRYAW